MLNNIFNDITNFKEDINEIKYAIYYIDYQIKYDVPELYKFFMDLIIILALFIFTYTIGYRTVNYNSSIDLIIIILNFIVVIIGYNQFNQLYNMISLI
jgi:hypothetical protein